MPHFFGWLDSGRHPGKLQSCTGPFPPPSYTAHHCSFPQPVPHLSPEPQRNLRLNAISARQRGTGTMSSSSLCSSASSSHKSQLKTYLPSPFLCFPVRPTARRGPSRAPAGSRISGFSSSEALLPRLTLSGHRSLRALPTSLTLREGSP